MFTCHGTQAGLPDPHQHETVEQSKPCYGLASTVTYSAPAVAPFRFGSRHFPDGPLSEPQYNLVKKLDGDLVHAMKLTYHQCHLYINTLLKRPKASSYTGSHSYSSYGGSYVPASHEEVEPEPIEAPKEVLTKLDLLKGIIDIVPDGYYAVQEYEGGHTTFLRKSSPTKGKFADSKKFQTVHGAGPGFGTTLKPAATLWWPSGRWSIYQHGFEDALMLLCADYQGASSRYSEKMGRCRRCNAELTDGRSRWYGIGPECEQHWPQRIEEVELVKGPFTGVR